MFNERGMNCPHSMNQPSSVSKELLHIDQISRIEAFRKAIVNWTKPFQSLLQFTAGFVKPGSDQPDPETVQVLSSQRQQVREGIIGEPCSI